MRVLKKRKWLLGVAVLLTFASVTWILLSTSVNSLTREENERMNELRKQGYSNQEIVEIISQEFGTTVNSDAVSLPPNENTSSTHTHTWITTVTKEATCTEQGEQTSTCSGCGETKVKTTPKAEHTYTVASTPGTCLEAAKEVYTCAVCGHSYTEKGKKGEHDYQLTNAESGTCQAPAKKTYTCSVCGDSYVEEGELGEHDYQLISESENDACNESGEVVYTCSICGDTYTETVEPLGHELETTETVL